MLIICDLRSICAIYGVFGQGKGQGKVREFCDPRKVGTLYIGQLRHVTVGLFFFCLIKQNKKKKK